MTLVEALEDLKGCSLVHLDKGSGLVAFWTGNRVFLEYRIRPDGTVMQADAWTASRHLSSAQDALAEAMARYGVVSG